MAVRNTKKSKAMGGVKALFVTASVAATLAGWAMLPANDPQSTVSANQQSNLTAQTVPKTRELSRDHWESSAGAGTAKLAEHAFAVHPLAFFKVNP